MDLIQKDTATENTDDVPGIIPREASLLDTAKANPPPPKRTTSNTHFTFNEWHKRVQETYDSVESSNMKDFAMGSCCQYFCCPCRWMDSLNLDKKICICCFKVRTFKEIVTYALLLMSVYGIIYSIWKESALPGGTVFFLISLFAASAIMGGVLSYAGLPPMIGYLLTGILIGNIPQHWVKVYNKEEIEYVAKIFERFITLLAVLRGGLFLDVTQIKDRISFILRLSFIPFAVEYFAITSSTVYLAGMPLKWACLQGSTLCAVSLATLTSAMEKNKTAGYGEDKNLPTVIIAAASCNLVFEMIAYLITLTIVFPEENFTFWGIVRSVTYQICIGLSLGIALGFLLAYFPDKHSREASLIRIVLLGVAIFGSGAILEEFKMVTAAILSTLVTAIIVINMWTELGLSEYNNPVMYFYSTIYYVTQPMTLALIGLSMKFHAETVDTVGTSIGILLLGLIGREIGSFVAMSGGSYKINFKEKSFICIAWASKGSFQALLAITVIIYVNSYNFTSEDEKIAGKLNAYIIKQTTLLSILLYTPIVHLIVKMFQRPKASETEEDLLKLQDKFFKDSGKPLPIKRKIEDDEEKVSKEAQIIGDIVEKRHESLNSVFNIKTKKEKGFPKPFVIDMSLGEKRISKKSLFAMQLEKNKNEETMDIDEISSDSSSDITKCEQLNLGNSDITHTVHKENLTKSLNISEKEILEEQKKLLNTLDPKLINFLKQRNKQKNSSVTPSMSELPVFTESTETSSLEDVKKNLEKYMDSKWINMSFIEKEKLEWLGDIPDKKSLEPDQPYSARFDFNGDLQPFSKEIDVRDALYHHGEEPNRPGYTIQELYQLSRSNVLQQRILALNTLTNIIRKTKLGYYDKCFEGQLLHKLVESDLFFLLRFSIDDNALVPVSVYCLYSLLCNESDEFCLDRLLGVTDTDEQPLLFNKMETNKDEEKELKDHVVIANDLIKGVLRTDLLVRLSYVLNNFSPTREVIIRVTNSLIRVSRHSLESAHKVLENKNLLQIVYMNVKSNTPIFEGVKLFRILAGSSKEIASAIVQNYDIKFLVSFIEEDEIKSISRKENYLLKLEIIYLWRNLLLNELFLPEFSNWSPHLVRLLLFYGEKVSVHDESDFDFELFSAITSLIVICNKRKVVSNSNIIHLMRLCMKKWLTQLMQHQKYNFACSKALGCTFRFFISYFDSFGVDKVDLEFIEYVNSILSSLFKSEIFKKMSSALIKNSYILFPTEVTRDPHNLPSLCTVYYGGNDYLKIVQNFSSLPFFVSLTKYLNTIYRICSDSKMITQFLGVSEIRNYLSKVCKMQNVVYSWFMKYETSFITNIVQLMWKVRNEEILNLSFNLLPYLRIDDENSKIIFSLIFDKNLWNTTLDFFGNLSNLYTGTFFQERESNAPVLYKTSLIPEAWVYKILYLLKEEDATKEIIDILKFIKLILENNSNLLEKVSYTYRYYYSSCVFLSDSNVFDSDIQFLMENILTDVVQSRKQVNLNLKLDENKSFYGFYTTLIIQYAAVSYGLPIFAKFVLFSLQNCFNVAFRKLIWFEYIHVLRVVTLSFPVDNFVDFKSFIEPVETDESLLVAYINSVSHNVITKKRNPFVYNIALGNLFMFLNSENPDQKLLNFLKRKINTLKNEEIKNDILNFTIK